MMNTHKSDGCDCERCQLVAALHGIAGISSKADRELAIAKAVLLVDKLMVALIGVQEAITNDIQDVLTAYHVLVTECIHRQNGSQFGPQASMTLMLLAVTRPEALDAVKLIVDKKMEEARAKAKMVESGGGPGSNGVH